jgi:oligopeptidase A
MASSVYWDFVELPSQLMENFCWERESLDLFARHHETGETIPAKLFKKMIAAKNYRSASDIMRQLSFGKLDLELHMHHATAKARTSMCSRAKSSRRLPHGAQRRRLRRWPAASVISSAAPWATPPATTATNGPRCSTRMPSPASKKKACSTPVGRDFRDKILSKGNSEDPAKLFRDFMGRDPDAKALLVRAGLA